MALISCENVSLGYEGVTVIKDINFKLENKDYLCIVGENHVAGFFQNNDIANGGYSIISLVIDDFICFYSIVVANDFDIADGGY